jgi:hypothetical protein
VRSWLFFLICTAVAAAVFGLAPGAYFAGRLSDQLKDQVSEPITWGLIATASVGMLAVPLFLLASRRFPADAAMVAREEDVS